MPSDSPKGQKFQNMDYKRRQDFGQFYSGQFRPYWLPYKLPGQPPVLVVQVPVPMRMDSNCFALEKQAGMQTSKSRAQRNRDLKRRQSFQERKTICAQMPFYGLERQELMHLLQSGADSQENKVTVELWETSLERKNVSLFPGSELPDNQFRKFFRPASRPDIHLAVNGTLVSSLKLAKTKIEELEAKLDQLSQSNILVQQQLAMEKDQSTETLGFHHFNNEMLRFKIADLEERNRQLQEANKLLLTATERLVDDKEQLSSVVQSCFENLDSYKRIKKTNKKVIPEQNDSHQIDSEQDCEWCPIVKAFYRVCSPT